ncbi:phosphatase PAP2 family protein [Ferribacterium limneticum]|uniref:phosphatase PAP2 family protein n=1 Tax=Ferribacterium limneticum TaxID=76259 RepID=UPI001CF8B1B2|nr:phosphatase PAP2 family protein [Ferribacterium limneticum]
MHLFDEPHWIRQIASRMIFLWPLKAVGTTLFMLLFFWGYFGVLRNPLFPVTLMPLTVVDQWIPVTAQAFPVYASLWVYASLPAALFKEFQTLALFGLWMGAMCLLCLGIFWVFPTGVPPAGIDWKLYPEMAIIKDVDASGNACPSLHVASAVFAAIWLDRLVTTISAPLVLRWLIWLHCLAILWSTVATRQHVVIDVVAGAVVGAVFGILGLRHALGRAKLQKI